MEIPALNTLGIIGICLSAIPFGVGVFFTVLPVLSKFGFIGFLYLPAYVVYSLVKHHEEVEYGFSLIWKSAVLLVPSILLVNYF